MCARPVRPDVDIAMEAGIPAHYASEDPDDVATTAGDGAPSPLLGALNAPGAATAASPARRSHPPVRLVKRVNLQKPSPGTRDERSGALEKARAAGYVGVGMVAAGTMGVAWSAVKATRDLVRQR